MAHDHASQPNERTNPKLKNCASDRPLQSPSLVHLFVLRGLERDSRFAVECSGGNRLRGKREERRARRHGQAGGSE